ncbi:MAG: putative small multi-drug export protein [Euryarchaeota archaeon ADurb.Bin190]|nr:MAG: putative small multi-drug export protein [Euryarchaeota archaeon ADurb.Bin190]
MQIILPAWLVTLLAAALPVSELRGAIPLAIGVYGYDPWQAYLLAVLGNLLPVVPLLLFLGPVSDWLRRFTFWDKFFTWLFSRTRRKYIREHESFSLTALALFVAVPLPVTGAWTGCAIAFLVGFRFWPAFVAISAGVLLAGVIVTATVLGVQWFW